MPPGYDISFMEKLVRLLGRHPLFDLSVQSAIRHDVLGGLLFAGSLFVLWVKAARTRENHARVAVLTTLFATGIAILFAMLASLAISWPPPYHSPEFANIYVKYFDDNPNTSSFPSFSVAVYTAVASGLCRLGRTLGLILWISVAVLIALPRMYIGGHYPSDIIAGLILGCAAFLSARYLLESWVVVRLEHWWEKAQRWRFVAESLVFAWIFEIAVEFREIIWLKTSLPYVLK